MNIRLQHAFQAAAVSAALGLMVAAARPGDETSGIPAVRSTLEQWVETRRVISAEKRDWDLGKEMLTSRADVLSREVESLKGRIADAQKSIAEADTKRLELAAENDRLAASSGTLATTIAALERRTITLLARLPDPIRERVAPLSQRIPDGSSEPKTSLTERYQNVVGVLNEIDKFHRDITLTSEVRKLGDGTTAEVTAIYFGIAQGFYVTANGRHAGVGIGGPDGWTWTPQDDAAPRIAKAIAIHKNEGVAEFVPLPVRIQ